MVNSNFITAKIPFRYHIIILVFSLLFCGYLAISMGKELCWDLANYHYYNPYAFLHHRSGVDVWPTSYIHMYLSPSMDFLTYFLINSVASKKVEFILGALHGLNLWLLFQIIYFSTKHIQNNLQRLGLALLLTLLGLFGPTVLPGMGSFQNDNLVSIFVLGFVLLQVIALNRYAKTHELSKSIIFFGGVLLGVGVGLKLTAGLFVIGSIVAFLFLPVQLVDRVKLLFLFGVAVISGMLLSSGYWMWMLWQKFHNPFFPFLNSIFHSSEFPEINWLDTRFFPKGLWQTLFYPFYFSWDGLTSDVPFRDFRFLVVYVLFVLTGVTWLWKKWREKSQESLNLTEIWILYFFLFSYITWQWYFSIMRYLAALEMLSPLIIYFLVRQLVKNYYTRLVCLTLIFYGLLFTVVVTGVIRAPWYDGDYFNIKLPTIVKQTPMATVLIAFPAYGTSTEPRPQTYLIPFFPQQWRFIGVPFANEKYLFENNAHIKISENIAHAEGPIYLLTSEDYMPELYRVAERMGLRASSQCHFIFSDRQRISNEDVMLCEVAKN